ncbi:protein mono-ADP-ribosyltransferase PARP14-like [Neolamprologus brichardi]|uniref:protein mono-ADP-ribosyltransferase PARP14-like n=1 Tax=Neolamprologus brichardi TaxID=32507 RepID=UPI001643EF08|nr:protein mono-ADP-ribosyltransferase PARP14-like [Neolamprologus brichardi]
MAGVHSYPLLVELEETNIPRLKIKLVKYFQSKKSNGGGECEVEYENGSRTAMLRFRREEDQRNVLAKESHQISLEKGVLKLTVRLPTEEKSSRETPSDKDNKKSDVAADKQPSAGKSNPTGKVETETEGGDDDTADEEPCSTSAVLGNILDNTNQEFLEMLVENITKSHDFTLEFFPDISSAVVTFQSGKGDVNRLEKSLSENINKIAKKIHREKSSRTEEIKVSPSVFHLLCQDGLMDKLLLVYPELKLSPESPNLNITGLGEEINAASKVILDAVLALKRQNLEVDKYVLELLKDEQQEELTDALLTSHQINAAFEISGNRVQLLAVSDRDLSHAQDHLGQLLTTQYINVEDSNVLKKPEWQQLVSHLEQANSKPCRTRINTTAQQVVVSGHKERVIKVQHQLGNFLTQNAHIEETVVVKANAVVKYLEDFNKSWMEKVKDKVRVSYRNEAICLSGSRVNVTHCKTVVEGAVSAVVFDSLNVYKSGVKKLFQENETYFSTIKTETDCLVQLVDKPGGGQDNVKQVPTPLYQLKMPGGVEIAVYKADMCSYPIEAVVSPFNQDLKHSTGLAAALLKAAGPQLQDEFYKMKKTKGQLKPGDCVITDAGGTLCCQKVIHAVAPKYEKPLQASAQLNKVVKGSLEFAEAHGCVSVALPSIGRGMRCFPLKQCELTIVKAVKEYCYENYDEITLQKIHFVNNDDIAVQDMVAAARQEFGNLSDSHSQQTPHLTAPTQPVSQSTGSDLCLNRVQTKEGVDIVLTKGNLEASTTEVIVNTVSSDLDLNRGAVSQAILRAAGPKLQQLVDAQGATGNVGEIIVTDGCQLKSKQVFHAIAPHYKDQATSEKCLQGLFLDCLDMAENNNLTSISLPAISTGDLCFPTTVVASLMLDTILEFSKMRHPKHLKMIVIVLYPADTQCIQDFSQEFKKFPNASGNSRSTKGGPFSKLTSNSDMHETKMGNVTIQVVTGDITKETTDIIVNSSNESFSLKSGVSKAILDAAGKAVEVECHNFSAKSNPGMIMTQPGNLKCKKILHVVGDSDPVKINKVVQDALQMCVKSSYTSVSFPAIGTGEIYSCMSYMPAEATCQAFAVQAKTSEYDEILKHFQASCSGFVTKIERIQNPGLWKSLEIKKREMELRNGHQNNERRLFHGTCDGAVPNINDRGFNRSYAGKNGVSTCHEKFRTRKFVGLSWLQGECGGLV